MKTISVISPCFNERENVRHCHERLKAVFAAELGAYRLEHIFADNASGDGTVEILRELAAADPGVKVILNARNFGPLRSLFNALRYATGDAVLVFLPVDLQDPPELIPEFVRHWEHGIEVVAGARVRRQEDALRRALRRGFYALLGRLADVEMPRGVGEFQLIDRAVWRALMERGDHDPFVRGLIAAVGFKRLVVPYTWRARERGSAKNGFPQLVDQALNGIVSCSRAPLRLCLGAGLALAALCALGGLGVLGAALVAPAAAPAASQVLLAALCFLAALQLFFTGVLGEYVAAIHAQVRNGPGVVERERLNVPAVESPD